MTANYTDGWRSGVVSVIKSLQHQHSSKSAPAASKIDKINIFTTIYCKNVATTTTILAFCLTGLLLQQQIQNLSGGRTVASAEHQPITVIYGQSPQWDLGAYKCAYK